jgi:hypothetical protein
VSTPPPTHWGIPDVTALDQIRGIYLAAAGLKTDDTMVLWHQCAGVGWPPRWIGTPVGKEVVAQRAPWTITTTLGCAACGLSGEIRDGRWLPTMADSRIR